MSEVDYDPRDMMRTLMDELIKLGYPREKIASKIITDLRDKEDRSMPFGLSASYIRQICRKYHMTNSKYSTVKNRKDKSVLS